MIDDLWGLACFVAELAEPLVEAFGVPIYKAISGNEPAAEQQHDTELSEKPLNQFPCAPRQIPRSEQRRVLKERSNF
jgi:hypothetical protein